jgi:hypothetical protein
MISVVPIRLQSTSGTGYLDAQTQTEPELELNEELDSKPTMKTVRFEDEIQGVSSSNRYYTLAESLKRFSQDSELPETESLKHGVDELSSYLETIRYTGFGPLSFGIKSQSVSSGSNDSVGDIKKEIRSIKGSLLST